MHRHPEQHARARSLPARHVRVDGLPQIGIPYPQGCLHGTSKYPLIKMLRFAGNDPILFSIADSLYHSRRHRNRVLWLHIRIVRIPPLAHCSDAVQGWPSIIVLLSIIGGMILLSIGIIGEYIGRIYESSQQRPTTL